MDLKDKTMPETQVGKSFRMTLSLALILFAVTGPAKAHDGSDASKTYAEIEDDSLKDAFLNVLVANGESSSGKLVLVSVSGASDRVILYAVQDRGLPRGNEYPTFVFKKARQAQKPELIFQTHAGTAVYLADPGSHAGCLFSAESGYSDICLADVNGNPAPDLPGLRDDVWTDFFRLLGL